MPSVISKLAAAHTVVTDRCDFFKWPVHYITYANSQPDCADRLSRRLARLSLSTSFSGVCTPSCAIEALRLASRCDGNASVIDSQFDFTYLFGIDRDTECRRECQTLPQPPDHMFGNIDGFLADGILNDCLDLGPEPDWTDLYDILWQPGAVRLYATCHTHGENCRCQLTTAWLHIAGPQCTDFSSQGKQRRCCGPSMRSTLIWIRHRTLLCEPVLLVENVSNFDHEWLQRLLPQYTLDFGVMDARDTGLPVSRLRKYMVLTFVGWKTERPLSQVADTFRRDRDHAFTMYDLFIAQKAELDLELSWGFNRHAKKKDNAAHPTASSGSSSTPAPKRTFTSALVAWETKFLQRYVIVKGPLRVYALQQDPDSAYGSASSLCELQCVIKASHLMWIHKLSRWMTGRELLLAQGFPVYESCLRDMQPWLMDHEQPSALCSFNRSRASAHQPPRCRKSFGSMAGNAMCVPVVGAFVTFCLMHVVQDDSCRPKLVASPSLSALQPADSASDFFSAVRARQQKRRRTSQSSSSSKHPSSNTPSSDVCLSRSSVTSGHSSGSASLALVPRDVSVSPPGAPHVVNLGDYGASRALRPLSNISNIPRRKVELLRMPVPAAPATEAAAHPANSVLVHHPGSTAPALDASEFFGRLSAQRKRRKP